MKAHSYSRFLSPLVEGLAAVLLTSGWCLTVLGGSFEVLHSFSGAVDGRQPRSRIAVDAAGGVYGTTEAGGTFDWGTVWKYDGASLTTLHNFNFSNGGAPFAGVTFDSGGRAYGTAMRGGLADAGTVWSLEGSVLTPLHDFNNSDGAFPRGDIAIDSFGNLYGTTSRGGSGYVPGGAAGGGVVWRYDGNNLTVLHSFSGADGISPGGALAFDDQGNLYGTTEAGGAHGAGALWKYDGASLTMLHSFSGADGQTPLSGVTIDDEGNLYGTTQAGGAHSVGTLWKYDGASLSTLHSFSGLDGTEPRGAVTLDAFGNLYGTTWGGGALGGAAGAVWKYNGAVLTTLHTFSGTDGAGPQAGLTFDAQGNVYGTTYFGGASNQGTLYRINKVVPEPDTLRLLNVAGIICLVVAWLRAPRRSHLVP